MRQPIHFTKTDLDEFATKANELSSWLTEKLSTAEINGITIPPKLTLIGAFVIVHGITILLDGQFPDVECWGGCEL